jgi:hypothetical protein
MYTGYLLLIEKTKLIYVIPKTNKSFITVANFFGDGHFFQKINNELTNNSLIGSWMIDIVISRSLIGSNPLRKNT